MRLCGFFLKSEAVFGKAARTLSTTLNAYSKSRFKLLIHKSYHTKTNKVI